MANLHRYTSTEALNISYSSVFWNSISLDNSR